MMPRPFNREHDEQRREEDAPRGGTRESAKADVAPSEEPGAAPAWKPSTAKLVTPKGVLKIGIAGGRQTGKTYLFQSIVYRTMDGSKSGALATFLGGEANEVFTGFDEETRASISHDDLIRFYPQWTRLTPSLQDVWYRLRIPYRSGFLGRRSTALDVAFLDAPGESFTLRGLASEAFQDVSVMIFCLPIWAVFNDPAALDKKSATDAKSALNDFESIVRLYRESLATKRRKVRVIVALTMADDRRSALDDVRTNWIEPFTNPKRTGRVLDVLAKPTALNGYLAAARRTSDYLRQRLRDHLNPKVSRIPGSFRGFERGTTWYVALSAIDGAKLAQLDATPIPQQAALAATFPPPVPAHVELPLLIALCERTNALM